VEDGLKMVISGGVFTPAQAKELAAQPAPRPGGLFRRLRGGNEAGSDDEGSA
jgi:hypothetical protein